MAVPNRPADETQNNVGKRYGPPQDTSTAPDNAFAGTTYVTGCSGSTATNKSKPDFRYVLNTGQTLNGNNLTVTESDGTVKQYFVSGNETTTDNYFTNPGLAESQYNALSASQKALYCDADGVSGGAITGVSITDEGEYLSESGRGAGAISGSGTGATFNLGYGTRAGQFGTSTYLKSVSVKNGGTGYKVGDTFRVAGVSFSPSIQQPATFKVTSATSITGGGGKRYLKSPSKRVREVSRPLNVRIWNPTAEPPPEADCKPAGQVVNTITVTGYIKGGTVLEQMQPPNVIGNGPYADASDFSQAVVHAGIAQEGETVTVDLVSYSQDKFAGWIGETRNDVMAIATNDAYCAYNIIPKTINPGPGNPGPGNPGPGNPDTPPIGEDTNCRYLRDEFYRGTNGTTNGQVDLNEIWNWLGSPKNNPNPICPRPENDQGLSQDNEPDMTDFAGLEIQRWQACTDGSNNGNPLLGGIQTETVPCTGDLDLSYFIDTRIAPWWGTQELAPPSLSMNKRNDNIYMVNVPPTQTETFFFKVQPTLTASNKKFFEVTGSVNYPSLTGTPTPGEPAIQLTNTVRIAWYRRTTANPELSVLGGIDTRAGQNITNNDGVQITAQGAPLNGNSGNFTTTLTVAEAIDGQCSESESNQLDFTQSGLEYFCKVEIDNRPYNPKSSFNAFLPGFGGRDSNISSYLSYPSKFFLNKIECNDASVSCNSGGQVEVPTGTFTTITFSMTISTNCLQYRSGTARISVKREWPCPVFGPASPTTNAWVVQKQSVSIPQTNQSSAVIQYTLQVPTDKSDYQPGEDGIDVAPGDCHWHYTAYWEIDYPGVECNYQAWSNPGCNYGEGRNQIDQIYCLQDNACTGSSSPSPSTSSPGTGYDPNCECPICEQTIIVRVLEESECGILGTPNQVEGGGDGPNNARIQLYSPTEGSKIISDSTFNPIVLNKDVLIDCDPEYVPGTTPDQKCIEMGTDTWVYLTRKTFDAFTTLGDDAAVKFNEEGEADCQEKVFTQSTWYRQYFYKNGTKSAISFQPVFLGGAEWDSYLRRYNPTASTATEALRYRGEVGISSKKGTTGFIDMAYDTETVTAVKLFVNIASTNDYFGNAIYHPPPPGFNERDFGTTTYVSSQRGSAGATSNNPARKEIFEVAHFSIADKQDVPVFTGTAGIACPSGDVPFEGKRLPPDLFEFCCGGEIGGCQNYGVSFACQGACDGGGCDVAPLAGPKQEVVICATNSDNNQFSIDWKDIPGNERKQLLILWYMKEPGQGPRLFNIGNLSQGERCSPDVRRFLNKAESEYTLSYYIVASSDGSAAWRAIEYDAQGQDGYFDVISWKLDPRYGTSGRAPVEQSQDRKEGERWQTIMGYAACTFRTGPDAEGLNLENPAGSISITNITNPNGTFPSPGSPAIGNCNGGECCNPANTGYYTKRCIEIRSALQASGIQCCATSSPSPNVSPTPGPSPAPFSPVGPGPFNPSNPNFNLF